MSSINISKDKKTVARFFFSQKPILLTCNLCMTSMEELSGFVFLLLMKLIGKMLQVTLFSYSLSFNEIGRIYVFVIGPSNQRMHLSVKVMSSNVSLRSFEEWSLKP